MKALFRHIKHSKRVKQFLVYAYIHFRTQEEDDGHIPCEYSKGLTEYLNNPLYTAIMDWETGTLTMTAKDVSVPDEGHTWTYSLKYILAYMEGQQQEVFRNKKKKH